MIKVFHNINFPFQAAWPVDFKLVAEVVTNEKNEAFEKTNHTSQSWLLNSGVHPIRTNNYGHRSTSVGDVMQMEDGKLWRVEIFGFKQFGSHSVQDTPEKEYNET